MFVSPLINQNVPIHIPTVIHICIFVRIAGSRGVWKTIIPSTHVGKDWAINKGATSTASVEIIIIIVVIGEPLMYQTLLAR